MKWYWILLIVVAAILIGWAIYKMTTKNKTATKPSGTTAAAATGANTSNTEVTTATTADGSKIVVATKK